MWLKNNYKLLFITFIVMTIIDIGYISINKKMYEVALDINNSKIYYGLIAWILMAVVLSYFIISNNTLNNKEKLMNAFILGICVYGIYNFTNMAILSKWTNQILIVDTLWGATLFTVVTFILLYLKDTYKLF
jgi:uncharacterized membrane protein